MFYYQPVAFYSRTVLDVIGASVQLLTTSGVVFVTGELVMDLVVVVVEAVVVDEGVVDVLVVVVVVVGSGQTTNSGQLQTLILESKFRPTGQDIRTGVRSTHS